MNFKFLFSKKYDKKIIDQFELIFKKIDINVQTEQSKINRIIIYKHQRQLIRHLLHYNNLSIIHSKQIGISFITLLYLLYKCISLEKQNIIIISNAENLLTIKALLSSIIIDKSIINITNTNLNSGIDFNNDSHITLLTDTKWLECESYLNNLLNITLFIDKINSTCISEYDILNYKKANQIILTLTNDIKMNEFINRLRQKCKYFKYYYINQFNIKFFKKKK